MPVIYLSQTLPQGFSGLPSDVGRATLIDAGLHDLTTPKMHSTHITICLVGSCPTFSPLLHLIWRSGYFLLHYSTLADGFLLGSRTLCVARTFLSCLHTSDKPADCFSVAKVRKLTGLCVCRVGNISKWYWKSLVMNANLSVRVVNCG